MPRFFTSLFLGTAVVASLAFTPAALRAEDKDHERSYHDAAKNDDHHWDDHEDRAYRMWVKENHRKYHEFAKLKEEDQRAYWAWRHEHSDALLKIDIR